MVESLGKKLAGWVRVEAMVAYLAGQNPSDLPEGGNGDAILV